MLLLAAVAYCLLLARLKQHVSTFRDFVLIPSTVIFGFVIYYIGYITLPEPDSRAVVVVRAIHSTAEMVFMQSEIDGISERMRNNNIYMVAYVVAHFLGILLAITAALSLFGRNLNAKIRLIVSHKKSCYILFGYSDEALLLCKDLLKNDPSRLVIFVGEKGEACDGELLDQIESNGAYYIDNSTAKNELGGKILFRHITNSESKILYISPDEDKNISNALHLFTLIKGLSAEQRAKVEKNTSVYLQIDSEDMTQIFEEARRQMGINIEYSIFNVPEIIATQLVRNYNPMEYINIDSSRGVASENFEVMIIGFGRIGRNILRRTIEYGQFVGSTYRATVVDREINSKIGSFEANYPALVENYNIESHSGMVGSGSFFTTLKERAPMLKQIIISLCDDAQNAKSAIEVNKVLTSLGYNNIDIFIVTRRDDNYHYLDDSDEFRAIHCIGQSRDIFSEQIILNEELKVQAKSINNYYNASKPPEKRKEWGMLENIKQQSNISAANNIPVKLKLLGLTAEHLRAMSLEQYKKLLRENTIKYENLARTEHLRWNATYFSRGWQRWDLKALPDHATNQNHPLKLHACLVEWGELDAVGDHFGGEPYKQYDFDNIDGLWELANNNLF